MNILTIDNLCKYYGNGDNKVIALDNINLKINKGEFIAIVGTSGSGKSTLLHIMGGVDKQTSGKVLLDGINIYEINDLEQSKLRRKKISLIYQFYNLIPTLNVKENILLPIMLDDGMYDDSYLNELIDMLGLNNRINHLPNELSGGQQQRVAIGRALMSKPSVLLADEPTGNLDSKNSLEIMQILKESNKKYNQTIVMVTHDKELAKYANRIIRIEDGKIVNDEVIHENN